MVSTRQEKIIQKILDNTHTIAMIGASDDPKRASNSVMQYLQTAGYRVIPVNPTITGEKIYGETVYARLSDIPFNFELVDVFRRVDAVPGIVDEMLPLIKKNNIRYLWLQLGISHPDSAARAEAAGLEVVMDHCLKIEHKRLSAG